MNSDTFARWLWGIAAALLVAGAGVWATAMYADLARAEDRHVRTVERWSRVEAKVDAVQEDIHKIEQDVGELRRFLMNPPGRTAP